MSDKLQEAIAAIKAGNDASGEVLLAQVLKADPRNETALMWLFKIAKTVERRRQCAEWSLKINPHSKWAKRGLTLLEMQQAGQEVTPTTEIGEEIVVAPAKALAQNATAIQNRSPSIVEPPYIQTASSAQIKQSEAPVSAAPKGKSGLIIPPESQPPPTNGVNVTKVMKPDTPPVEISHHTDLTDAFLSYSRKDKPFVQKLYETLKAQDRNIWIDWGNIPLTADWRQEIREGIERASSIVFILSPDFLASHECGVELDMAIELNKRLIPIVYRDVKPDNVPPALASLNWIFFRAEDNFDSAFQTLSESLDTDLEWVKAHTRLLVRATEWDEQEQNKSFLLHGDDLTDAESRLAMTAKEPELTPLQGEYIVTSRRNEVRRQKMMLGRITVGFIISIVLAIVAFFQYLNAEMQKEIAEDNALQALSHQLAAQSVSYADDKLDLALLLNLEADNIAHSIENVDQENLLSGLVYSPYLTKFLHAHTDVVRRLAFNPAGKILASSGRDGTIILWDMETGQPLIPPLAAHDDWINALAFSPAGKILASGSHDNTIKLWNPTTGQLIGQLTGHKDNVHYVSFSPDGKILVSASEDKTVCLWDISKQEQLGELSGHTDTVLMVTFNPKGDILASSSKDGTVRLWDPVSHKTLGQPLAEHKGNVWSIAFSPDGKTLASAGDDARVIFWDVEQQKPIGEPLMAPAAVYTLAFSPNGRVLASSGDDKVISLWDIETRQSVGPPLSGHTAWIGDIAFSPNRQTLASGSADNTIILWDVRVKRFLSEHTHWVYSAVFSPDGQKIASGSYDDTVILWDANSNEIIGKPLDLHKGATEQVAFSPDSKLLASASRDKSIRLWDTASGEPVNGPLKGHQEGVKAVVFSSDNKTLVSASTDGQIILWDVGSGKLLKRSANKHAATLTALVLSPDDKLLATASDNQTIILWHVETLTPLGEPFSYHDAAINTLAFNPNGTLLASGDANNAVILWDVAKQKMVGIPLEGHTNEVLSVAFNHDGTLLASGSADNFIILWNVESQTPTGPPLTGHLNAITTVNFSPDGKRLVSGSRDSNIILWDVNLEPWQERACHIANRNLTEEEWDHFIGSTPAYRLTCPHLPSPPEVNLTANSG